MTMIVIKDLTPVIKYENIKIENKCYEMLTAAVSHDMRTPLNAILGLLTAIEIYINSEQGKKLHQIITNSA
jgi:signal transduction histidine kinase